MNLYRSQKDIRAPRVSRMMCALLFALIAILYCNGQAQSSPEPPPSDTVVKPPTPPPPTLPKDNEVWVHGIYDEDFNLKYSTFLKKLEEALKMGPGYKVDYVVIGTPERQADGRIRSPIRIYWSFSADGVKAKGEIKGDMRSADRDAEHIQFLRHASGTPELPLPTLLLSSLCFAGSVMRSHRRIRSGFDFSKECHP